MRSVGCLLVALGGVFSCRAADLVLAERGKPAACAVVVPQGCDLVNDKAAREFIRLVKETTGVDLPMTTDEKQLPECAVLIGRTRHADAVLGASGRQEFDARDVSSFRLAVRGRRLVITGNSTALIYGAYEVFQRFAGVEWYTDTVSCVPNLDRLCVPADLDETVRPSIAIRDPGWGIFRNAGAAARFRVNGTHVGHSKYYGFSPIGWHPGFKHCHSFKQIASKDEFGKTHPEYFLKGTNGVPSIKWEKHPQLCLTEPGVRKLAKERFLAAVAESPKIRYFGVSQADNERWCHCPACEAINRREGSASGTLVLFLNELADELAKVRPDAMLTTLAYHQTRNPPKTLELRKNVLVGLCVTECDFSRPIVGHPNEGNRTFLAALEKWAKISGGVWIWDYSTDYYWYPHAMPNVHALAGNLRLYADNGVPYVYESATGCPYAFFGDLKAYVTAKLMWNVHQPLEPLIERFMKACYGPAAGKAREVFDLFENYERDLVNVRMSYSEDATSTNFPSSLFERAAVLWKEAQKAADGKEPYADFARRGRFGNDTTRLFRYLNTWARQGVREPADEDYRQEMLAVAREFAEIDRQRIAAEEAAGDEKPTFGGWGWSYTSRKNFKALVYSFLGSGGQSVKASKPEKKSRKKTK